MDYSPPGFFVHGISQAGLLEWVAISFSRGFSLPGIEPAALTLQADSLPLSHLGKSVCTLSLLHVYFYLPCSTETYFLLGQFPHSSPVTAHTYISALGESPSWDTSSHLTSWPMVLPQGSLKVPNSLGSLPQNPQATVFILSLIFQDPLVYIFCILDIWLQNVIASSCVGPQHDNMLGNSLSTGTVRCFLWPSPVQEHKSQA